MIETFALPLPSGIALQCRACGPAGAKRAMLLHGFPEAAFVWDDTMRALAGEARCIAPNLRGYGGSGAPAGDAAYRMAALMGDVAAAIEATGAPLDLLVAHDWGGAVAWSLAAARPDLMKRLLIVNAPHAGTFVRELLASPAQRQASAYMDWLRAPGAADKLAEDGFRRLWRMFTGFGGAGEPAWLTPALREQYLAVWSRGLDPLLAWYRATPLHPPAGPDDPLHRLALPDEALAVKLPTTVIWGERDTALLPGLLDGLEHWVPDLRIVRVPDAGHWVVHERPDVVIGEIRRALA